MATNELRANHELSKEYIQMYYEHQYDRLAKLEEQGLTITNVVVSLSVVAFTFGFKDVPEVSIIAGVGLPALMIIANAFAIFYIMQTSAWIRSHKRRAKRILEVYSPDLLKLEQETIEPHRTGVWILGRRRIQMLLHILLIISSALIPFIIYL